MTQERDDLLKLLERATTKEASLQDTLALMTEKATDYEEELSTAKKKMKDDEEAISLLRNKVEESRYVHLPLSLWFSPGVGYDLLMMIELTRCIQFLGED
jgi:hypothetical protein